MDHDRNSVLDNRERAFALADVAGRHLALALDAIDCMMTPQDDYGTCLLDYLPDGPGVPLAGGQSWDTRTATHIAYGHLAGSSLYPASIILRGQTPG